MIVILVVYVMVLSAILYFKFKDSEPIYYDIPDYEGDENAIDIERELDSKEILKEMEKKSLVK